MFKSIFSKYFTVMSLVIVVSFLAMGGMQLLFSTQYWMDEKRTLLIDNADDIAKHTAVNTFQVSTDAQREKAVRHPGRHPGPGAQSAVHRYPVPGADYG